MLTRRTFLATGAAMAAALPAPAIAARREFRLEERFKPRWVKVRSEFKPGTIHVWPSHHYLYFVTEPEKAIRYGVAVGSAGRNLRGTVTVRRKAEWPSWTPTPSMIRREPKVYAKYAGGMPGGPDNPLGARALYLYRGGRDTLYRIHGTPQPWTIGRSVSSGCIRMVNAHVEDLYERVPLGTKVTVHPA